MQYIAITSLNSKTTTDALALDTFAPDKAKALKRKALDAMGITKMPMENFLDAYLRHIAEINGLPVTKPAHPDIVDICFAVDAIRRTVWLLA